LVPLAVALSGVAYLVMGTPGPLNTSISKWLCISVVGSASFLLLWLVNGRRKFRAAWRSYQLTLDAAWISTKAVGLVATEIRRDEVTRIVDRPGYGLTIFGPEKGPVVFIPEELVGYAEVRAVLAEWRTLET